MVAASEVGCLNAHRRSKHADGGITCVGRSASIELCRESLSRSSFDAGSRPLSELTCHPLPYCTRNAPFPRDPPDGGQDLTCTEADFSVSGGLVCWTRPRCPAAFQPGGTVDAG